MNQTRVVYAPQFRQQMARLVGIRRKAIEAIELATELLLERGVSMTLHHR